MTVEVGLHTIVQGRVQEVSFRYFIIRRERNMALTEYVHNLSKGHSVEVVAEGNRENLEELLRHLNLGPLGSAVQQVGANWTESSGALQGFPVVYRMPLDGRWNDISWTV